MGGGWALLRLPVLLPQGGVDGGIFVVQTVEKIEGHAGKGSDAGQENKVYFINEQIQKLTKAALQM